MDSEKENHPSGAPAPDDSADEDSFFILYATTTTNNTQRFLSDTDRHVEMLNNEQYKQIRKVFVKYNTVWPSCAPSRAPIQFSA